MISKRITETNQQQKSEKPQGSGILQRTAVRSVADAGVQLTDAQKAQPLSNSVFSKDFSQVPIRTTKPQPFQARSPQSHPVSPIQAKLTMGEAGDRVIQGKGEMTRNSQESSEEQRPNQTGLPDRLKTGIENLSGYSLDDVRVHYQSSKPSELRALAYTLGKEIHVAPGQEEHLPHEAWHVVQKMQGRVTPTRQMKGVQINDDKGLEREADVMGAKAMQMDGLKKIAFEFPIHAKTFKIGTKLADTNQSPTAKKYPELFNITHLQPLQNKNANRSVAQLVSLENSDIHGYKSLEETIIEGLTTSGIEPNKTLLISIGRSPIVFTTYLELQGWRVVYIPMSGLSAYGKEYKVLTEKYNGDPKGFDTDVKNKGSDMLDHYLKGYLDKVAAMITIDFGVSGGSNKAAYEIVKYYLNQKGQQRKILVKMATLVRPGTEDNENLTHPDNLLHTTKNDSENEAVKRVLWVMHHEIDKGLAFLPKYSVTEHKIGDIPPMPDPTKKEQLKSALRAAEEEYTSQTKKDKDFIPPPNTLNFSSNKSEWIEKHRKTILDKVGQHTVKISLLVLALLAFIWSYMSKAEGESP